MKRNLNTLTEEEFMDKTGAVSSRKQVLQWLKDTFASDPEPVDDATLERVIREAIETWHTNEDVNGMNLSAYIEKAIRPYTHAFEPDWDKAPDWANECIPTWYGKDGLIGSCAGPIFKRPIPPKRKVRKSNVSILLDLQAHGVSPIQIALALADGKTIEDLCDEHGVDMENEA